MTKIETLLSRDPPFNKKRNIIEYLTQKMNEGCQPIYKIRIYLMVNKITDILTLQVVG